MRPLDFPENVPLAKKKHTGHAILKSVSVIRRRRANCVWSRSIPMERLVGPFGLTVRNGPG
jgi:hypothetical protein